MEGLRQFIKDTFDVEPNEFKWDEWVYHFKDTDITIGIGKYDTPDERNGKQFISYGWDYRYEQRGGGTPLDSYEELEQRFSKHANLKAIQTSLF